LKIYADTNFFTAFLLGPEDERRAAALLRSVPAGESRPLPVTRLLRLEVTNSLQRFVFEQRSGATEVRVTREAALMAEAEFGEVERRAQLWTRVIEPETEVDRIFLDLVHRHTARHGFRTYDILHVATALALGCDTFWSFDAKAKKLAKLEGLKTN
jgi:predicted nucleic acid-binding protein